MSNLVNTTRGFLDHVQNYTILDDCDDITSGGKWTNLTTGSGAAVAADTGIGGVMTLTTGATAANVTARAQTNPNYIPAADIGAAFRCRLKFTEASTNKANMFAGFSSAFPADTMQATNLGPNTSFSGVGFYKKGGNTFWSICVSNATTQTLVDLTSSNARSQFGGPGLPTQSSGAGAWTDLKVEVANVRATLMDCLFTINGTLVYKVVDFTWTSMAAMGIGVQTKAGAASSEVLYLDYLRAQVTRFAQPF